MKKYWRVAYKVIKESDILLEIIDARFIEDTRNKVIERKILSAGKKLIIVINKSDLVSKVKKIPNSIYISSKIRLGTKRLRDLIFSKAKKNALTKVGVLGYPNTGKSSVINSLKGGGSARVSPESGFTKGMQYIKLNKRIMLIDTPGVIPFSKRNALKLVLIGSKNFADLKDPESVAEEIIERYKEKIREVYGIKSLEELAIKYNKLKKGGVPNTKEAARILITDWQRGKLKI